MAWMPSYVSANKATSEQFGTGQISDFDRRDGGDHCSKRGFSKRPPASRHIHWSQPSSPKRHRRNSGSCIAIDFFNLDTRVFGVDDMFTNDDWFSVNAGTHPSNLSSNYQSNCSNTYSTSYPSANYPPNHSVVQQHQVMSQPQFQQQPQQQQFQQVQYQYPSGYQQQLQMYQHPPAPPADDARNQQQQRLEKTTEILKEGGLYDVAVKTATLIRQHEKSKKELEELRAQTKIFLEEVLNNPENQKVNQVFQEMQHQQANPQLPVEKAVRNLFDQSYPSSASFRET